MQIGDAPEWQIGIFDRITNQDNISGDFRDLSGHILYEQMGMERQTRFIAAHTRTLSADEHEACRAHAQIVALACLNSGYNQRQTSAFSYV